MNAADGRGPVDRDVGRMPAGVEAMTKEELWAWFERSARAATLARQHRHDYWTTTTGLSHVLADHGIPDFPTTVEMQRAKIVGLRKQMQQMHAGYRRKIARLERRIAELTPNAEVSGGGTPSA